MKIALIGLTYPFRGGIAHYTSLLCRELRKDHQVEFLSLKSQYPRLLFPGRTQIDESEEKIAVENRPILHPLLPWTWLSAFLRIRTFSPDLILFQWWHPFFALGFGTLALGLRLYGRAKIIFLCHNVRPHESTGLDTLLIRYAFCAPTDFIVHAESDLKVLRELKPGARAFKTPHPTYEVFHTGKRLNPDQAKRQLEIDGDLLLFFGYVRKYKGLEYLLQALPAVLRERDCTLLVVGEIYEDKANYLSLIDRLHLADRVRLIDRYVPNEEVGLYFEAADAVVLPYISATQSGIIQIAYGFRKPVITTRVGGIPEVVEDGVSGFLTEPGNPDALAEAILLFFQKRTSMDFQKNIEMLQEKFTWGRMVRLIEQIHGMA